MKRALLLLLLASPALADPPKTVVVQRAVLLLPNGAEADVGPGLYVPEATALANEEARRKDKARIAELERNQAPVGPAPEEPDCGPAVVVMAVVAVAAAGLALWAGKSQR